jgi:hypothetical protein
VSTTALQKPPAPALIGMHEVARVSSPITDEDLELFLNWAEATFGEGSAAHGDGTWITIYAPPVA